jgi:hypothetical protein
MNDDNEILTDSALDFFGKSSASISHEIKNTIAIIKESAGLIDDFVLATQKGYPLSPERLARVAGTINRQVLRTDGIVKNLNQFGHSVDKSSATLDVNDTIRLAVAIAERPVKMRGVEFGSFEPKEAVTVTTRPFFLLNLIWRSINFAAGCVDEEKTIALVAEKTAIGAKISISGLKDLKKAATGIFPGAAEKALSIILKAELTLAEDSNRIQLILAADAD